MEIVFLNTFEKAGVDHDVTTAQLSICERQGVWSVLWMEVKDQEEEPVTWFEGTSWEEMLMTFRHGVAKVMGKGYTPIIDGMLDDGRTINGGFRSMLQCYGELHYKDELFQQLREWRRSAATTERKSAYIIATNRILWMISAFVPQTKEELMQIPGWGAAKNELYGEAVLAITSGTERNTTFPLDWVADELDTSSYTEWLFKQKEQKYQSLMERHRENKTILSMLHRDGTLDQLEKELSLPRRELIMRIEQLDQEGYDIEPFLKRELLTVPEEEKQRVRESLSLLGDRYLKPVMQQVYGEGNGEVQADKLYERLRLIRMNYRRQRHEGAAI
ncbi:HRDC domain-containing protein [Paenibacillus chungangensis]|uniref:HRDC domain-containing protein n=1 Tax=Paenibacillus chungangensis TaxID=696535 RepID=A0ABW3HV76_9BACL